MKFVIIPGQPIPRCNLRLLNTSVAPIIVSLNEVDHHAFPSISRLSAISADAAGRFASAVRGPAKWPIAEWDMAQVSPSWTWRQPRYNTGIRGLRNPIFFFSGSLCSTSFRESILRANNVAGREGPEPSQHWVSSKKHEPYEAPWFFFTYSSPDRNQLRASVMPTLSNSISRREQKWGKGWIGSWIRPFAPSFPLLIRSLESGTRGCRAPEPPISGIAVMRRPLALYVRKGRRVLRCPRDCIPAPFGPISVALWNARFSGFGTDARKGIAALFYF